MYIYIYIDEDNSYIDTTKDYNILDLAKYKRGESWILSGCLTYTSSYINKELQKDIPSLIKYYEEKYIKKVQPEVVPIATDEIRIDKYVYNIKLVKPYWGFNPIEDIWLKSQEIFYDKASGGLTAYKVDSFLTKDRANFYNIIYNIGVGAVSSHLNPHDFNDESFSNYIDYNENWTLLNYDGLQFSDTDRIFFSIHPDSSNRD